MPLPAIIGGGIAAYRAYKAARAALAAYKAMKRLKQINDARKALERARKAQDALRKAKRAKEAAEKAKKARDAKGKGKRKSRQACTSIECRRRKAVREAWKKEQDKVRRTGRGSRNWTDKEKRELLETGKVKGYQGHHINSVQSHPGLAGNPNNIKFVKGTTEHLKAHGGSFRNPTSGPLINR